MQERTERSRRLVDELMRRMLRTGWSELLAVSALTSAFATAEADGTRYLVGADDTSQLSLVLGHGVTVMEQSVLAERKRKSATYDRGGSRAAIKCSLSG